MTYPASTIGYWVGQSNDTSTGTHPPGWTSGQRWSETATEWNGAYNQSQTDLANMTTDRNNWQSSSNTWQGRANNAWGASRVWNSGESWEAAYNRVLPAALWDGAANIGGYTPGWNAWGSSTAGLTVPYTGYYALLGEAQLSNTNHNDDGDFIMVRLLDNGAVLFQSPREQAKNKQPPGTYRSAHYCQGLVQIVANHSITLQGYSYSQNANPSVTFQNVLIRARFVPTQAQPH